MGSWGALAVSVAIQFGTVRIQSSANQRYTIWAVSDAGLMMMSHIWHKRHKLVVSAG
jgi:hypothetical protein